MLSLNKPEDPVVLNPDIDKDVFTETRQKYEKHLDEMNAVCIADKAVSQSRSLDSVFDTLNQKAAPSDADTKSRGIKSFLKKWLNALARFALSSEINRTDQYIAAATQTLNELNKSLKEFGERQREMNHQTAMYGQTVVPVIDEKVRRAFEGAVKSLNQRMDILHEGLDRRQTEVITWLHNTGQHLKDLV